MESAVTQLIQFLIQITGVKKAYHFRCNNKGVINYCTVLYLPDLAVIIFFYYVFITTLYFVQR